MLKPDPFFLQDVQTPRSNRSVDSGLPQDDITPRSDSLSTASSSASPPDGHNGHVGQTHLGAHHLHQQHQQHLQHQVSNQPCIFRAFHDLFTVQGRPKPRKAGFENVTHQVTPPYYSVPCHSSWIKRSEQLTLVRWGSCADLLKQDGKLI